MPIKIVSQSMVVLENSEFPNIVNDLWLSSSSSPLKIQFSPSIVKLPEIENKKLITGLLVTSDIILTKTQ